jgi:hypothetical protein
MHLFSVGNWILIVIAYTYIMFLRLSIGVTVHSGSIYMYICAIINVCINESWVGLFRKKVQCFKCVRRGIVIIRRRRPIVASSHYIMAGFGCFRVRARADYYHIRCRWYYRDGLGSRSSSLSFFSLVFCISRKTIVATFDNGIAVFHTIFWYFWFGFYFKAIHFLNCFQHPGNKNGVTLHE